MELLTKASYSDEVTKRERYNLDVAYRAYPAPSKGVVARAKTANLKT